MEPCPQNSTLYPLGLYLKISDEHIHNFYVGVSPPIPGIKIQTYLIEFTLWGKLFQLTDSPQSDRFLSVHYLIDFRLFFLLFFCTRLWQSVTMLIGGIRYSVKANNQTKNKVEITRFTSITVWDSDRVSHNL